MSDLALSSITSAAAAALETALIRESLGKHLTKSQVQTGLRTPLASSYTSTRLHSTSSKFLLSSADSMGDDKASKTSASQSTVHYLTKSSAAATATSLKDKALVPTTVETMPTAVETSTIAMPTASASKTTSALQICMTSTGSRPATISPKISNLVRKAYNGMGDGNSTSLTVYEYNCAGGEVSTTAPNLASQSQLPSSSNTDANATSPPLVGSASSGTGATSTASFFASPTGKGTIAGISLGASALAVFLFFFLIWRKRRDSDSHESRHLARDSGSSFGGSSTSLGVAERNHNEGTMEDLNMQEVSHHQGGEAGAGTFFVENRRHENMPNASGNTTNTRYGSGRLTIPASAFTGAAALTSSRPALVRQALSDQSVSSPNDKGDGGSNGFKAYQQPSSDGHTTVSHAIHDSLLQNAQAHGVSAPAGPQRRASGYMSDTYRSRQTRPVRHFLWSVLSAEHLILTWHMCLNSQLSVRNPDSEETHKQVPHMDEYNPGGAPSMYLASPAPLSPRNSRQQHWRPWQTPIYYSNRRSDQQKTLSGTAPSAEGESSLYNPNQPTQPHGRSNSEFSPSNFPGQNDEGFEVAPRPWENEGRHTPQQIQDVQLGPAAGVQ